MIEVGSTLSVVIFVLLFVIILTEGRNPV